MKEYFPKGKNVASKMRRRCEADFVFGHSFLKSELMMVVTLGPHSLTILKNIPFLSIFRKFENNTTFD